HFTGNAALGGGGGAGFHGSNSSDGGFGGGAGGGALHLGFNRLLDASGGPLSFDDNLVQGGDGGSGSENELLGRASAFGGALDSEGVANLAGANFFNNRAQGGNVAYSPVITTFVYGGAAYGGAIVSFVALTLSNSSLVSN